MFLRSISLILLLGLVMVNISCHHFLNSISVTDRIKTYSLSEARTVADSSNQTLLVIVLAEADQYLAAGLSYETLGLTEKGDHLYRKALNSKYLVVLLTTDQFELEYPISLRYYERSRIMVAEALKNQRSFLFISGHSNPSVYSPTYLQDTELLRDILWVGFGP